MGLGLASRGRFGDDSADLRLRLVGGGTQIRCFGASTICVTDLARRSPSPITFGRNDISPVCSSSGKRLAFFRARGKDAGVHIVDSARTRHDGLWAIYART
jgi:hypothetical protein